MKPQKLTYLKKGKAFGSNEHKGLTDTFNWLVRFCNNLRGDGVYIDVANPWGDDPVITLSPTMPLGGGGTTYTPYPQPFDFISKVEQETQTIDGQEVQVDVTNYYITRCFFYAGRNFYSTQDKKVTSAGTYFFKITTNNQGAVNSFDWQVTNDAIPTAGQASFGPSNTDTYTYFPVWRIEDTDGNGTFKPTFDYRPTWKLPFYST